MERLLNIKEAAELLNVSEITIRRWTNRGLLKCYRVGGRRARRFNLQDLQAVLEGDSLSTKSEMVSLGFNGLMVPDGAHVTHLSKGASEALEVAVAFIADGLATNDTVGIVTPESEAQKIVKFLQQRNLDVEELRRSGRLHFSGGMNTPQGQGEYLKEIAALSQRRSRIFGDMTWTKAKDWRSNDLLVLEELVNRFPAKNILYLCQYKLDRFSGEETMSAIETHSHYIYRGALNENPSR